MLFPCTEETYQRIARARISAASRAHGQADKKEACENSLFPDLAHIDLEP